jgi:hypothetical protein
MVGYAVQKECLTKALIFLLLVGCETPSKPSNEIVDNLAPTKDAGYMSIAGPQGVAHGEFNVDADFQTRKGKWSLTVIEDAEGFMDGESLQLYGERLENGEYLFTDVENYLKTRDRDPAVAAYFVGGKLTRILYGTWPTYISKSRDQLKMIKRYAGSYSVTQDGESIPIEFSLVVNWNQEPAKGSYWQSHLETEGRIPETVTIADHWSFASNELHAREGKCKGCKQVAIFKQKEDDSGNVVVEGKDPAVTIEISGDQKIQSLSAGDSKVKLK